MEYEDGQPLEHTVIRFIDGGTEGPSVHACVCVLCLALHSVQLRHDRLPLSSHSLFRQASRATCASSIRAGLRAWSAQWSSSRRRWNALITVFSLSLSLALFLALSLSLSLSLSPSLSHSLSLSLTLSLALVLSLTSSENVPALHHRKHAASAGALH